MKTSVKLKTKIKVILDQIQDILSCWLIEWKDWRNFYCRIRAKLVIKASFSHPTYLLGISIRINQLVSRSLVAVTSVELKPSRGSVVWCKGPKLNLLKIPPNLQQLMSPWFS